MLGSGVFDFFGGSNFASLLFAVSAACFSSTFGFDEDSAVALFFLLSFSSSFLPSSSFFSLAAAIFELFGLSFSFFELLASFAAFGFSSFKLLLSLALEPDFSSLASLFSFVLFDFSSFELLGFSVLAVEDLRLSSFELLASFELLCLVFSSFELLDFGLTSFELLDFSILALEDLGLSSFELLGFAASLLLGFASLLLSRFFSDFASLALFSAAAHGSLFFAFSSLAALLFESPNFSARFLSSASAFLLESAFSVFASEVGFAFEVLRGLALAAASIDSSRLRGLAASTSVGGRVLEALRVDLTVNDFLSSSSAAGCVLEALRVGFLAAASSFDLLGFESLLLGRSVDDLLASFGLLLLLSRVRASDDVAFWHRRLAAFSKRFVAAFQPSLSRCRFLPSTRQFLLCSSCSMTMILACFRLQRRLSACSSRVAPTFSLPTWRLFSSLMMKLWRTRIWRSW